MDMDFPPKVGFLVDLRCPAAAAHSAPPPTRTAPDNPSLNDSSINKSLCLFNYSDIFSGS